MARRKDRTRSSKNTGSPRVPNRTTATLGPQPNLCVAESRGNIEVEPEALVVSHWIDPGEAGETFPVTIFPFLRLMKRRFGFCRMPSC